MTDPIDMLLQTAAGALVVALVVGYWPAPWAATQQVVEGLGEEERPGWSSVLAEPPR